MINQDQLIKGILEFINLYKRLPYYIEDEIEVEVTNDEGELELRPYRALKYVKECFANQDKCTQYLFDNRLITYEMISEIINIDENRLEKLLNKDIKVPDVMERRYIELFFNKDYFSELGNYTEICNGCSKKCQKPYWVGVVVVISMWQRNQKLKNNFKGWFPSGRKKKSSRRYIKTNGEVDRSRTNYGRLSISIIINCIRRIR